jgi:hypothetical protein
VKVCNSTPFLTERTSMVGSGDLGWTKGDRDPARSGRIRTWSDTIPFGTLAGSTVPIPPH